MTYEYVRPTWFEAKSERDIETSFLLTELYNLFGCDKKASLLDVGFAGSGYIEKILDFENIDYTGLDCNAKRIRGKLLRIPGTSELGYSKERWRAVIQRIKCINADIVDYSSSVLYDVVISISTIEHIMSAEYSPGTTAELYRDIQAVDAMKKLVKKDGYLLLTFPCGVERALLLLKKFKDADGILRDKSVKSRSDLLIYGKDRINKVIDAWKLVRERYWIGEGESFEECKKDVALGVIYTASDYGIKSLCTLLLRR